VTPDDLTGTLGGLCRWWLDNRCPPAGRAVEIQRLQKHVIGTPIGALSLGCVRAPVIDDLLHCLDRAGAAPASVNKLRSVLHTVFAKAKKAGRWVGENPAAGAERRKVPKRVYITLSPEQLGPMLEQVPEDWRPLFACGPALGLRKGELFALQKTDVDLARGTLTVSRSHERNATKGGDPSVLPIPAPLRPWIEHQMKHAPGALLFPAPDGSQRPREADPQKILRTALARAGIVEGYEHRCRWCGFSLRAPDAEPRYCATCKKTTDGRGNQVENPRGRRLWPRAIQIKMRFHDLRHTFATELLRQGVDVHRVQRLMRHSDVRVTTGTYAHLLVEDLRAAVDAHAPVPAMPAQPETPARGLGVEGSAPSAPPAVRERAKPGNEQATKALGDSRGLDWWALQDSNLRPLPCEGEKAPRSRACQNQSEGYLAQAAATISPLQISMVALAFFNGKRKVWNVARCCAAVVQEVPPMGKANVEKREARLRALGLRGRLPEVLTERLLDAVRAHPTGDRYVITDGDVPGLVLQVAPNGAASFLLHYRTREGRQRTIKIAAAGAMPLEAVRSAGRARLVDVERGGDPAEEKREARAEAERAKTSTVRAYLEQIYGPLVLSHRKDGGKPKTADDKPSGTWARILAAWAPLLDVQLAALTRDAIEKVLADRKEEGKAMGTLLRDWAAFRALMADAVDRRHIAGVPMGRRPEPIRKGKGNQRVRWIGQRDSDEQIAEGTGEAKRLFDALDAFTSEERAGGDFLRCVVRLALATGMRRGELVALNESMISRRERTITLPASLTKTNRDRVVHLSDAALGALKSWKLRGAHGELFPGEQERWEDRITQREWPRLCAAAGVTDLHFHDLRHDFAVRLRKAGKALEVVRDALGHSSIVQTEKYAHVGPSEVRDAVLGALVS